MTPSTESEDSSDNTTKEEVEEDQPKGVKQEQELETDKNSKPMQDEKEVPDEEGILQNKNESKTSGVSFILLTLKLKAFSEYNVWNNSAEGEVSCGTVVGSMSAQ